MGMTKEGRRKHMSLSGNTVILQFCFTDILIISHMTCANMSNPSAVNCHRAECRALHLLQIAVQHFWGVRATAACFFIICSATGNESIPLLDEGGWRAWVTTRPSIFYKAQQLCVLKHDFEPLCVCICVC